MTKFRIPRTSREVTDKLGELGRLLTATEWTKAALVASVVRLAETRGGDRRSSSFKAGNGFETADEFANRGINGLRSKSTVTLYVQRWLDANHGVYPALGATVNLPDIEWPPTRTGTDGYESIQGAAHVLEQLIEKHGTQIIVEAVRRPEVADAVVRDRDAGSEVIRASGRRQAALPPPPEHRPGALSDVLLKLLQQVGAIAYEHQGKKLHENLLARHQDDIPWRPGEREAITERVNEGIRWGQNCQVLLAGVSDDDLARLLGE